MITVFDEYGREMQIPREAWRRDVLPAHLQENWSSPDALYSAIVLALGDGFHADVAKAAARLYAIDTNRERGACLHAIVLMQNNRIAEAERVLRDALQTFPRSAPLLTNLAKVHEAKGEKQKTQQVLWQAITADPNFENAIKWYAAMKHERDGEFGWIEAMQRIAAIEGSWRAKLMLARLHLDAKNLPAARELYEKVLLMAADGDGALMQISGDLGRAGYIDEIVDFVYPFYDYARHDVVAGLNFLQAFVELGDWKRGEELLHKLMLLDVPPYRERLMWYSARFAEMKQKPPAPEPIGELRVEILRLDQPVWTTGLGGPRWLLPAEEPEANAIAILSFSNTTPRGGLLRENEALVGTEDDIGRLTRAIPLHLSDVLRFRTNALPAVYLPVVLGGGMMVTGKEPEAEDVRAMSGGAGFAIAGTVSMQDEQLQIELILWRTADDRPFARFTEHGAPENLAAIYQRAEAGLLQLLEFELIAAPRDADPRFRVPDEIFRFYLDGLGQAYALALSAIHPAPGLYGERNIHRWLLNLALELPENPVPRIALLSALANTRRRGSELHREVEKETLKLFSTGDRELYRLSPMVFRLFDRTEEFEARRVELMAGASDDYVRWLAELETAF